MGTTPFEEPDMFTNIPYGNIQDPEWRHRAALGLIRGGFDIILFDNTIFGIG